MRSIKKIHTAVSSPIADLITYRALPTNSVDHIDPFLFLNHHGYQEYPENNNGLPFGPHPHRGFETVTFILKGDLTHKDSGGFESVIKAGGVQWMTAGKGLIHAEISSEEFKKKGGELEILQLWVNLPAKHKMTEPNYKGIQKEDIPQLTLNDGKVKLAAVSGNWEEKSGAFEPLNDIQIATVEFANGGKYSLDIPSEKNIFFYVVKGKVKVNGEEAKMHNLVEFTNDGEKLEIEAQEESIVLLGHAAPFNEPIVAQGPFVMNSQEEIQQAFQDYQNGIFGNWNG
ncbi:pirin family protein [Salegentibacter sp. JZCK2]|uniref:pirin family protein n=1 Tax=Salegentibacter tibetensis TaxID=2873600 RepID=UPI001CCB70CB|nr:pirin family protein [Salegentibacter tibetensis]MBZ9731263.1 pirin family protein [Salegentibacter tibetensis]